MTPGGAPEPTLEQLQLAYGYHVASRIVAADGSVDADELQALNFLFPRDQMIAAGFLDAERNEATPAFGATVQWAIRDLGGRLDDEQRLNLLRIFVEMALADGVFHPAEVEIVREAALELGFSAEELEEHIGQLVREAVSRPARRPAERKPAGNPTMELPAGWPES